MMKVFYSFVTTGCMTKIILMIRRYDQLVTGIAVHAAGGKL